MAKTSFGVSSSKNQLQDAGGIAQIGKDDAALIAGTGDRTADGHLLPGIGQADLAAVIGTAQGIPIVSIVPVPFTLSGSAPGRAAVFFQTYYYTAPRRIWQEGHTEIYLIRQKTA